MEKKNELIEIRKDEDGLINRVRDLVINTVETLKEAVEITKETRGIGDRLKTLKDFILKHPRLQIKETNVEFKPAEDALKSCDSELQGKIVVFQKEDKKKRLAEEERLQKEQEKKFKKATVKAEKKGDTPPPPPAPIHISKPKVDGLSMRETWDCEVDDAEKVPFKLNGVQLHKIDLVAARKLVRAGIREIPGLRIFEKMGTAISRKEESVDDL